MYRLKDKKHRKGNYLEVLYLILEPNKGAVINV